MKLLRLSGFTPMAVAMFVLGTALSFTAPYVSLYGVNHAHMSPGHLGFFMTMMAVSGVAISRYLGKRSDAAPNRRPYVLVANFAAVIGYGGLGLTSNYWIIMILGCVFLGIAAAILPQMFAFSKTALTFSDDEQEDLGMAGLRTLVSIAWVFGPSIGAILLSLLDFDGLFGIAAGCFLLAGLLVLRVKAPAVPHHTVRTQPAAPLDSGMVELTMPDCATPCTDGAPRRAAPAVASRASTATLAQSASRAAVAAPKAAHAGAVPSKEAAAAAVPTKDAGTAASPRKPFDMTIMLAFTAFTLIGVSGAALMIALPIYMVNVLHGNSHQVAMMFGWGALLEVPIMLGFGLSSKRLPKSKLIAAGALIHVVYFVSILFADSAEHLVPLQAANAFVVSVFSCLGMQYFQELMPGEPGAATTLFFNTNRVGAIVAGVLTGWIAGLFGYWQVFVMCACLSGIAFVMLVYLARAEGRVRGKAGKAKLAS
ncbi:sugar efflux transporter [Pararobbsia silviterrae]|uniref:sugar efflux transporter n=1 Tax=Pararobbsia silviterrae TaxID=1792498 RepID=UPI0011C3E2AB|nr:sugar efflux transporter [Pararobbsia silviterrae]